jgi:DNA repair photolyase
MPARRGRAAAFNPPGRFERYHVEEDAEALDEEDLRRIDTQFLRDSSRSVLAKNDSPDVPFTFSLNPYRGCEHGCIYCYARTTHEYLGFSAGLDFETRILVKPDAPRLLASHFEKRSWTPQVVALSGDTDPYQPVERRLRITRRCLEVFLEYRNPVQIITKNRLVSRDIDLLSEMATLNLVSVAVSITSLRPELTGIMEPRTARPDARLRTIEQLAGAGIPVGVLVAPVVPGLTDEEMPKILRESAKRGARSGGYIVMRLPGAVKPLFLDWLDRELPDRANRIRARLRELHGSEMTDSRFGSRQRGRGPWAKVFADLFELSRRQSGLATSGPPLATHHFRRRDDRQASLFQ